MSNIATLPVPSTYDNRQIALIKRTVAADTNDDEFNLFLHTARHLRLDPLRRQVYALVYNKSNQEKRKMSIIVGIDGFRTIADRTGNYRPDEDEPDIEFDDTLKSPTNPAGIVKAKVKVWKFSHGAWHKTTGVARWTEFVPLTEEWAYDAEQGKRAPTGRVTLDPKSNWFRMPCVMLPKCAESAALRKAWPDDLTHVYAPEEMERLQAIDLLPSEAAVAGATEERLERIGHKDTILMGWADGKLAPVPVGQIADRAMAFVKEHREEPSTIMQWREQNRHGLKEFWARSPSDALAVKKEIEAALAVPA